MPLSEHEQRMLDQIESALYAEDPKFASTVRGGRIRAASTRRRFQAVALFVIGLILLIAGVALPIKPGGFPIISLVGFVFMFGSGVLLLLRKPATSQSDRSGGADTASPGETRRPGSAPRRGPRRGFSSRMEDRFKRRFDQE
ncbi:hypothetical protein ASG56_17125 [Rhodococcus sp. Leaf7]|uniref:DUF3040 domain-containing protein n=1 Tax=unclassified Rhodococcus (in: high G+C Gram-positive bacteria) TaxID=192944 RepID=UPI0005ACE111|nr:MULTISPECIES: DUF3040 domain-containing protein [unclassified Rhodococcus (in: high G+C Gram-positive bacteria)]KIQ16184.1 membrane protein [Rhodococcus sp. MEB064]KQU02642.1 hypothetical protein ASG56_17125 [Rhodococcus sp. Leaf7]KQU38114.1 hypothetical protein ASG64_19855 [Rhodococcus sp. Leaf247]